MKLIGVIVLVIGVVRAETPYPASGWQPAGDRLWLPKQEVVPHTVYGPPTTTEAAVTDAPGYSYPAPAQPEEPGSGYGAPPAAQPNNEYGAPPPAQPDNSYGVPPPTQPDNSYGAPPQPQPDNSYGAPPDAQPDNSYGAPPEQPEDPNNAYGPPDNSYPSAQPNNGYGASDSAPEAETEPVGYDYAPPQQPGGDYGAPAQPQNPDSEYGAPIPTQPSAAPAPLDPGATERLRQSQFFQQLPSFQPSRFVKPQALRRPQNLRIEPRRPQSARLQNLPQLRVRPQQSFQRLRPLQQQFQRPQFQQQQQFQRQQPQPQQQQYQQTTTQQKFQNIRQVNKAQSTSTNINNPEHSALKFRTDYRTISDTDYKKFPARLRKQKLQKAITNLEVETFDAQRLPKPVTFNDNDSAKQGRVDASAKPNGGADTRTGAAKLTKPNGNDVENKKQFGLDLPANGAGHYYVLQNDGLLQKVIYRKSNGRLIDGSIISGLKYDDISPIDAPIYSINFDNQFATLS